MIGEDNPLNYLLDDLAEEGHHPDWATITSVDPLRARKDHEANALEVTPQSLVRELQVGDRVLLAEWQGQPVILGTGGGPTPVSVSVDVDNAYTLSGWRVRSAGRGMVTVWGQFTKKTGNVAQGDVLGALSVHVSPLVTGFAQGVASVVTKVVVNGTVLSVAGAPTGSTTYVRVDGLSLPIGG